jgi:hypothetical protein
VVGENCSSCPKAAIQRSIDDRVRLVSKLPFIGSRFLHWSVEVCHFQIFSAKEVVKATSSRPLKAVRTLYNAGRQTCSRPAME